MDAALYVKEKQDYFDVIIVDSSDPVGGFSFSSITQRSCREPLHGLLL